MLDLCEQHAELAEPIAPGRPDLLDEVVIAATREQARSVADVLLRRTRLGLVAAPQLRAGEAVERVASVLGAELGWSDVRVAAELDAWTRISGAEGLGPAGALAK